MERVRIPNSVGGNKSAFIGSFDGKDDVIFLTPSFYGLSYYSDIRSKDVEYLFKGRAVKYTHKSDIFSGAEGEANGRSMLIPSGVIESGNRSFLNVIGAFSHFKGESVKGGGWWVFDEKADKGKGAMVAFPNRAFPNSSVLSLIKRRILRRMETPISLGIDRSIELISSGNFLSGEKYTYYNNEKNGAFLKNESGRVYPLQQRTGKEIQKWTEDNRELKVEMIKFISSAESEGRKLLENKPEVLSASIRSTVRTDFRISETEIDLCSEEALNDMIHTSYLVEDKHVGNMILRAPVDLGGLPELSDDNVKSLCEGKTIEVEWAHWTKKRGYSADAGSTVSISPKDFESTRFLAAARKARGTKLAQPLYTEVKKAIAREGKEQLERISEKKAQPLEKETPNKSVRMKFK